MYSCPGCGGNITFDIKAQTMKCAHCGTTADPYSYDNKSDAEERTEMDVVIYTCPQCGGEIACDQNEAAAFCSYCGASTILSGRVDKMLRPKFIIPFKKTKEECANAYRERMRNAFFAPNSIKNVSNIESFRGIYMPYWLYSFRKDDNVNVAGKKEYRRGDYIITEHYSISSYVNFDYAGVSYDASSSFSDDISQAIAPYNVKECSFFSPAYFSGFYADTFDVPYETYVTEAMENVTDEVFNIFVKDPSIGRLSVNKEKEKVKFNSQCYETNLAAFPVWFMAYRMKIKNSDRIAYLAINGQTGKIMGDIPISIKKYSIAVAILSVIIFMLMNLFFTLKPIATLIVTLIISVISRVLVANQNTNIAKKELGLLDKGLNKKADAKVIKEHKKYDRISVMISNVVLWCISFLIILFQPNEDLAYYIPAILQSIVSLLNLLLLINNFNMYTTRALPQFKRKGGDDSANFSELNMQ